MIWQKLYTTEMQVTATAICWKKSFKHTHTQRERKTKSKRKKKKRFVFIHKKSNMQIYHVLLAAQISLVHAVLHLILNCCVIFVFLKNIIFTLNPNK